jgi:integrase
MDDSTLAAIRDATQQYRYNNGGHPTKTVVNDEQQAEIRADTRPWAVIATEYEISRAAVYRIKKGTYRTGGSGVRRCPNGEMYACIYDLAYLTALRAKDCRELKWADITDDYIYVAPTKTRESSDVKLEIAVTPAIRAVLDRARALGKVKSPTYVFHTLKGTAISASGLKSAWRRARTRAGISGNERFRDLRPKALSDAKKRGMTLEALRDAAGHTNVSTTESYLLGFEVKRVNLGLETLLAGPKKKILSR